MLVTHGVQDTTKQTVLQLPASYRTLDLTLLQPQVELHTNVQGCT